MALLRARVNSVVFGLIVGLIVGQGSGSISTAAPAAKEPAPRLLVGIKGKLTPAIIAELKKTFKNRIVRLAPIGGNTFVLLPRGETLAQLQKKSRLVNYVEPEAAMGADPVARTLLVIVPAPQWQKAPSK